MLLSETNIILIVNYNWNFFLFLRKAKKKSKSLLNEKIKDIYITAAKLLWW